MNRWRRRRVEKEEEDMDMEEERKKKKKEEYLFATHALLVWHPHPILNFLEKSGLDEGYSQGVS